MLKKNNTVINEEELEIIKNIKGDRSVGGDIRLLSASIYEECVVCGINIKTIDSMLLQKGKTQIFKKKWGLFVHLKREDGSQIDLVYSLGKTTNSQDSIPCKKLKNKHPMIVMATIPSVFESFGVEEWVQMVGTHILLRYIIDEDKELLIVPKNNKHYNIYPDYFDLQPK